jgi:tetratricopeptide (TPR) repeat protein
LKARSVSFATASISPADVFQVEIAATYVSDAPEKLDRLVKRTLSQNPPDPALLDTAVHVATYYRDFTNAVRVVEKQLQIAPNNVTCLINKGYLEIQMTNYSAAIPALTKALSLEPTNNTAVFCRAVSYFESGRLDEAQRDYELLQKLNPKEFPAYHGLAEIALRRKDTNTAIRYFQLDLTNAPANSGEAKYATDRLKELKKPSP